VRDSGESVGEGIRGKIDALARRYGLTEDAAAALEELVSLADWEQANFLPAPDPIRRQQAKNPRTDAWQRRAAANMLAESLSALTLDPVCSARCVADIGSGAGFPGLVLAIAVPHADVVLIERREDICRFLRYAIAELGLQNVQVIQEHVKPGKPWHYQRCFDVVTSRNVFHPHTMLELGVPLLAPRGHIVVWQKNKRRNRDVEVLATEAAGRLGLQFDRICRSEYLHDGRVQVNLLYVFRHVVQADHPSQRQTRWSWRRTWTR
jgi:16S rRNA (guanine527-N7)-methyltransferase